MRGPDGKEYRWTLGARVPSVRLFHSLATLLMTAIYQLASNDKSATPVANFHRASRGILGPKQHAYLEIHPEGEGMVEEIVISFVYAEKLRRDKERAAKRSNGGGGA